MFPSIRFKKQMLDIRSCWSLCECIYFDAWVHLISDISRLLLKNNSSGRLSLSPKSYFYPTSVSMTRQNYMLNTFCVYISVRNQAEWVDFSTRVNVLVWWCFTFSTYRWFEAPHLSLCTHNPLLTAAHGAEDLQHGRQRNRHITWKHRLDKRWRWSSHMIWISWFYFPDAPPGSVSHRQRSVWLFCEGPDKFTASGSGRGGGEEMRIKRLMRPH